MSSRAPHVDRLSRSDLATVTRRRPESGTAGIVRRSAVYQQRRSPHARGDRRDQCSARIRPINTLVRSVNTNACRNATNTSSTMTPVASSEAPMPTA